MPVHSSIAANKVNSNRFKVFPENQCVQLTGVRRSFLDYPERVFPYLSKSHSGEQRVTLLQAWLPMPFGFMHDDGLLDQALHGLDAPFGFAFGSIALCVGGGIANASACGPAPLVLLTASLCTEVFSGRQP
jgi:hypothetical protein